MKLGSFSFVSDDVAPELIRAVTNDCEHGDCCLSARIAGSTLDALSNHYNKLGIKVIERNPAGFEAYVACRKCWKGWKLNQDFKVLEYKEPQNAST